MISEVSSTESVVWVIIATCSREGEPNVTYLSHVRLLDEKRVALSCQFFNKTKQNVLENPYASVIVYDPITFESWHLKLRYDHAETSGSLFDDSATVVPWPCRSEYRAQSSIAYVLSVCQSAIARQAPRAPGRLSQ